MKTYIRLIFCLLLFFGTLLFLGGCRKSVLQEDRPGFSPEDTALVDISFLLRYDKMATKAGGVDVETRISNLNLFFVHDRYPSSDAPEVRHYYFDLKDQDVVGALKLTNIRLGSYTLYAVANSQGNMCGMDHTGGTSVSDNLCSMTRADIEEKVVRPALEGQDMLLVMTAKQSVTIKKYDQQLQLSLTRRSAKIDFNYTVTDKGKQIGLNIQSITLQNRATDIKPFSSALPTLFSSLTHVVDPTDAQLGRFICYPLENRQTGGTNFSGGEAGRTALTAPPDATFLYLGGKYRSEGQEKQVGFSIYLGEELDGNNFEVIGNRHCRINAYFNGIDPNDNRISWISIDPGNAFQPLQTYLGQPVEATVEVDCRNYFNDRLYLYPQALVTGREGAFRVFVINENGTEQEIFQTEDDGFFLMDTGISGMGYAKCRITYVHTSKPESVRMSLSVKNRLGEIALFIQDLQIKYM